MLSAIMRLEIFTERFPRLSSAELEIAYPVKDAGPRRTLEYSKREPDHK